MTKDTIEQFSKNYYTLCKELKLFILPREEDHEAKRLYHYTSIEVFHNIIDNCEFWAHNTRFSNDYSEEKVVSEQILKKNNYTSDNYFICLCKKGDLLSQWRGYCSDGGVSIELSFPEKIINFSILGNKNNHIPDVLNFYGSPLPVSYVIEDNAELFPYKIEKNLFFLPLFKIDYFNEEKEYRILFNNKEHFLDKYIFERKLENSTRVPFIKVKFNKVFDFQSTKKNFKSANQGYEKLIKKTKYVFGTHYLSIPENKQQESIFNTMSAKLEEYYKNEGIPPEAKRNRITIICEGKPPITEIRIAPMSDQERVREQIEHICKTRYWLRNVPVVCSEIPYNNFLGKK